MQIRNYKSIAFCDVTLEPLTVLVGRNGAGKSNFLDALSFLRDVLARGLGDALLARGGWEAILHRGAANQELSIHVELEYRATGPHDPKLSAFEPSGVGMEIEGSQDAPTKENWRDAVLVAKYKFSITQEDLRPPAVSQESCQVQWPAGTVDAYERTGNGVVRIFGSSDPARPNSIEARRVLVSSDPTKGLRLFRAGPAFQEVAIILAAMRPYNFHPERQRSPQKRNVGWPLERDGANVASVIQTTRLLDPYAVQRIERYVSAVVPEVVGVSVRPLAEYETMVFKVESKEGEPPREFVSSSMSDGTLRTLAAVTAVFQSTPDGAPSLVAIEEPETSLHPASLRALAAAFDEGTLRTQVLVTTHSPDLLDCETINPGNIRVAAFVDGATSITKLDAAAVGIVRDQLNTLGGLERDRHLELNQEDLDRQAALAADDKVAQ